MDIKKVLGNNVRRLRTEAGMPQDKLAELMGVDQSYVSHLENGKKNPTIDTVSLAAQALGSTPADLLRETSHD